MNFCRFRRIKQMFTSIFQHFQVVKKSRDQTSGTECVGENMQEMSFNK